MSALRLYPSQSNFQLIDFPSADLVRDCTARLADEGILVRRFGRRRRMQRRCGSRSATARRCNGLPP